MPQSSLEWNEKRAVELAALPLSCIDRPQPAPRGRSYLFEVTYRLRDGYEGALAFYGCSDWHSAVNSTWTLVKVLREYPGSAVASLIREKLDNHLSATSLEGELAYFRDEARPGFERPYGWAWLMKLYVELFAWKDDPDAQRWAGDLRPLAELLAERAVQYLDHLAYPIRVGTHANTAFSLSLMLGYARTAPDDRLRDAIEERATHFYQRDRDCALAYEPSGSDFLSPCLAEAVLMSQLVDEAAFVAWLDAFWPSDVRSLDTLRTRPSMQTSYLSLPSLPEAVPETESEGETAAGLSEGEEVAVDTEREMERRLAGARSHLIGLAFARAAALRRIADALPREDPRGRTFRELAGLQASYGFETMYEANYFGTHWLASFAVDMLTASPP